MSAATTTLTDHAIAAAVAGVSSLPPAGNGGGTLRPVMSVAGGAEPTHRARTNAQAIRDATVRDLLSQRANLPAGHPDRIALRARIIEAGLPMALGLAGRYRGRGEPLEDLYQVAVVGLVHAVDRYDPTRQTAFASYAVPTIVGAIKRHFRDTTWRMRVPRPVRELATSLTPVSAALAQRLGRTPTRSDLAVHLDAAEEDIAEALDARRARHPESLDALSVPGDKDRRPLVDTLCVVDPRLDAVIDRQTLRPLLAALPVRQRHILAMRYFDDLTQAEIAVRVGVSQMHVSRLLARALAGLRTGMLAEGSPHPRPQAYRPRVGRQPGRV